MLARIVFPEASVGVAETTAARLRAEPGVAQRHLHAFDTDDYVRAAAAAVAWGSAQALPVPGTVELGALELELIAADGHTQDGMAIWAPFAGVLCVGDYLSPVEIPWLQEQGSATAYLATLRRLEPYVTKAEWIVPGHGEPLDSARALAIMREDVAYLEALPAEDAPLPLARRDRRQNKIHKRQPRAVLQHVALETRPGDVDAEVALLGRAGLRRRGAAGIASRDRATWVERSGTQIHLLPTDDAGRAAARPHRRGVPGLRRASSTRSPGSASRSTSVRATGARRAASCGPRAATASRSCRLVQVTSEVQVRGESASLRSVKPNEW